MSKLATDRNLKSSFSHVYRKPTQSIGWLILHDWTVWCLRNDEAHLCVCLWMVPKSLRHTSLQSSKLAESTDRFWGGLVRPVITVEGTACLQEETIEGMSWGLDFSPKLSARLPWSQQLLHTIPTRQTKSKELVCSSKWRLVSVWPQQWLKRITKEWTEKSPGPSGKVDRNLQKAERNLKKV